MFISSNICNETITTVSLVIVFVLSFLIFRYIASRKEMSIEQSQERINKAQEYLNRHLRENEDFFFN
jgi:preprotein translocase subunit SecG